LLSLDKGEALLDCRIEYTDVVLLRFYFFRIIFLTIRYGDRMRASVDVGLSTIENDS
jgi:hypothetical protein